MATKKQVEEAIFQREGFRVELVPFDEKKISLAPYEWNAMAPQRWKISDWKNARLEEYRLVIKGATVYRGDGSAVTRDMQLGNLRDTYYEAEYGAIRAAEPIEEAETKKVVSLAKRRKKSSGARRG